ncbi:MAG: hypothetical protein J0G95_00790, partial [Rhizobiales bacterium]|nr:hypothetical protein [Hyphomicrobiales bacterium]
MAAAGAGCAGGAVRGGVDAVFSCAGFGAAGGSAVMMLIGGIEAALGKSPETGLPVGTVVPT